LNLDLVADRLVHAPRKGVAQQDFGLAIFKAAPEVKVRASNSKESARQQKPAR